MPKIKDCLTVQQNIKFGGSVELARIRKDTTVEEGA